MGHRHSKNNFKGGNHVNARNMATAVRGGYRI